ncbi:cell wall-binding repeat-containing protein [Paenisporosarcina antarctica]|uniref:Endonuclease n=1 Tax=Paenisporosarcina antarctica TaxID=417367 RepID=A0A4P6ZZL7_9BACL|nr:cell wall-binding repeat-containing protein [Paenisporosarcina antarctica]QBP42031.1 endonuclease [Paenisporosarcina antarctica]
MSKEGILKHALSKMLLAILLVISMVAPFITAPSVQAADTITVAEAIANNTGAATVKGFIVGTASSGSSYDQDPPFTVNSNVGLADSPDETNAAKILPVQLPNTAVRTAINLKDNPENFKAEVTITGNLEAYFSVPGLKSASAYTIISEGEPAPEAEEMADIAAARAVTDETKLIKVTGTVTTGTGFWGGKAFYIQDDSAGIYVYTTAADVQPGDIVELEGKVSPYNGELQIQPSKISVKSSANPLPAAQDITPAGVKEDTQAERILLNNVTISDLTKVNDYGTFEFTATHENGESVVIRNDNRNGLAYDDFIKRYKNGDLVNVSGIASKFDTTYQVKTLGLESFDLVNKPAVYTDIFPGTVSEGTEISLITPIEGATIYYTVDGSTPTPASTQYTTPITLTKDATIKAIAVSDKTSEVFSFTYKILKVDNLFIRDIQGDGHYSDYEGANVKDITGVVTHLYNGANFVIQDINPDDDNTTSEALIVNKASNGLKVGDLVTVEGTVEEWFYEGYSDMKSNDLPVTRIRATSTVASETATIPAPLVIGVDIFPPTEMIDNDQLTSFDPEEDGIDFWESVELMRLSVPNAKVVGPQKYGEVVVVAENSTNNDFNVLGGINISATDYNPERIIVDFDNEDYDAKSGDYYTGNIIGVMGFGFGNYKLWAQESDLPDITRVDKPNLVTDIEPVEDKLNVAAYNVENFSNNSTQTPDEKVEKIARSFVDNMKSPDIITLVEVQDNDGATASNNPDATESYERLIAAIVAAGGPTYEWTDIAPEYNEDGGQPGGNIRVGYLYNPERVTLSKGTKGSSTEAVTWVDGELSKNPGRILDLPQANTRKPLAAQFEFQGEKVVVIGTHLNSKGGDQPLFGKNQPPFLGSEAERIELATMINDFIKKGQEQDPNLKVILAGDMNDFEFTPTLEALKGGILTNMIEKVPAGERFTYYYQGNNQVLDHILVSDNLAERTQVDIIHVNSNYMEIHGRASDHEPVLIQVDLKDPVDAVKTLSVNKTTVDLEVDATEQLVVTETTTKADDTSTDEDVTATATYNGFDTEVISVNAGLITAKAEGTTSITVTVGDNTKTVNVTVQKGAKTVERISGTDRIKTAIAISKKGWDTANTVILAQGYDFPDALAASPLAYQLDSPILLTKQNTLSAETIAELKRLETKKVIIVGGELAISQEVVNTLYSHGIFVERIAGKNRFETAMKIAKRMGGNPTKAIVTDGFSFPDALTISSYAAQNGYPILLTKTNSLPSETKDALQSIPNTIVMGGTLAVSTSVFDQLNKPVRIAGKSRYETAVAVIEMLDLSTDKVYVATGEAFADAMTGSVLAAKNKAPIILVRHNGIPQPTADLIEKYDIRNFTLLGGELAIGKDLFE